MPKLNINKPIEAYKSISEVSELIGVESHVLRFWEKEFSQIKPTRANGRRCYSNSTINAISTIKDLLHNQGYTLQGAKRFLKENKEHTVSSSSQNTLLQKLHQIKAILE